MEPESAASIQAPSQPDMRAQMQQQAQQAEPATQQEATAAAPMAAAEAAKTSDAPVAEKTPEHSTAEPAEPPKTEAQDGEIPAVAETEAEQLCRKKRNIPLRNLAGRMGWQRRSRAVVCDFCVYFAGAAGGECDHQRPELQDRIEGVYYR